jgi:hypothetical protein
VTGRADLHIHTLASDGISGVEEVLRHAIERVGLDVIAITDHERIDAALAARSMAEDRGLPIEVIVGEEVTTRSGHLVGLFLQRRIRPWGSLRATVARVHEQGGLAVVAHPLVPYPLCASERTIRRLMDDPDPLVHPDAIEAYNPTTARMRWSTRAPDVAADLGLAAVAASDAHRAEAVGRASTGFPGRSAEDVRAAIVARTTTWQGRPYAWREQMGMFRAQVGKYAVGLRDDVRGGVRRDGSGRDLGYPGGRRRPASYDPTAAGLEAGPEVGGEVEEPDRGGGGGVA